MTGLMRPDSSNRTGEEDGRPGRHVRVKTPGQEEAGADQSGWPVRSKHRTMRSRRTDRDVVSGKSTGWENRTLPDQGTTGWPVRLEHPVVKRVLKTGVPMGRKSEADIEVEKQELAARHTAQFGKSLGSQPGSEEERRQQALAMLRKKAQAKSDGKRVVADKGMADDAHKQAKRDGKRTAAGDSVTDGANKQAPPKRAKAPRHSSVRALVVENQQQRTRERGHKKEKNGAIRHPIIAISTGCLTTPSSLPVVPDDFYSDFGIVGFFVQRFMHYKSWAWTNRDSGLMGDASIPIREVAKAELLLPNSDLTPLSTSETSALTSVRSTSLGVMDSFALTLPQGEKAARKKSAYDQEHTEEPLLISLVLLATSSSNAPVSCLLGPFAKLMTRSAPSRGAVAGCKAEDFDLDALNALPAQPLHDPSAPRTKNKPPRLRNPYVAPSEVRKQVTFPKHHS
ncbi:hypothetical protein Bca52824_026805 [Brassica carinata]|uniref:Uncharacterized protein n=1 Tax=Brassica carinata TaxID=52824 RepID=A0A8X7SIR9_BRACI|nr:hypothetical protein Bca52824_026805 [Brassica carinata]